MKNLVPSYTQPSMVARLKNWLVAGLICPLKTLFKNSAMLLPIVAALLLLIKAFGGEQVLFHYVEELIAMCSRAWEGGLSHYANALSAAPELSTSNPPITPACQIPWEPVVFQKIVEILTGQAFMLFALVLMLITGIIVATTANLLILIPSIFIMMLPFFITKLVGC